MFNLFGTLFFGSRATTTVNTVDEQLQQSDDLKSLTPNTDACTQTPPSTTSNELLMISQTQESKSTTTTPAPSDWVIVEKRSPVIQQQQQLRHESVATSTHVDEAEMPAEIDEPVRKEVEEGDDDDDVLLGSFFERQETNCPNEWLITPLPCLTSITCSQRSLVDNDPLENLLIEHPSMSVFVTVTSSALDASCFQENVVVSVWYFLFYKNFFFVTNEIFILTDIEE